MVLRFLPEYIGDVLRAYAFGAFLLIMLSILIPAIAMVMLPRSFWFDWQVEPQSTVNAVGEPLMMVSTTRVRTRWGPISWTVKTDYLDILRCDGGRFRTESVSSGAFGPEWDFTERKSRPWPYNQVPITPRVCDMQSHITAHLPLGLQHSQIVLSGPIEFR